MTMSMNKNVYHVQLIAQKCIYVQIVYTKIMTLNISVFPFDTTRRDVDYVTHLHIKTCFFVINYEDKKKDL